MNRHRKTKHRADRKYLVPAGVAGTGVLTSCLAALVGKLSVPTLLAFNGILLGIMVIVLVAVETWPPRDRNLAGYFGLLLLLAIPVSYASGRLVEYASRQRGVLRGRVDLAGRAQCVDIRVMVIDAVDAIGYGDIVLKDGTFYAAGLHPRHCYVLLYVVVGDSLLVTESDGMASAEDEPVQMFSYPRTGSATISFPPILFADGSADLTANGRQALRQIQLWLVQNPDCDLLIEGHCSEVGSVRFNQKLGMKRAKAISDFLKGQDIDGKRLVRASFAYRDLASQGTTSGDHQKNRRVRCVGVRRLDGWQGYRARLATQGWDEPGAAMASRNANP